MVTNEAGILLMHKDLQKYVGSAAVIGCAGSSDPWLLAPDFYSADERSRNVIDRERYPDLSRSKAANEARLEPGNATLSQVTVTSGEVPVTPAAGSEIAWQAGMCKRMRNVRSYAPLRVGESPEYLDGRTSKPERSEKHQWQAGMYKGMHSLAGYVARRTRDNWDS